jgi:hypothetical protein
MLKRLETHLKKNNILVPEQNGFRKGIFIDNAIFNLTDKILTSIDQCQQMGGIFVTCPRNIPSMVQVLS